MTKPILSLLKNNQILRITASHSYIKVFFLKKLLNRYSLLTSQYHLSRSTRWVPVCAIQGKTKKVLKIYGFNRHVIRDVNMRSNLKQISTHSW